MSECNDDNRSALNRFFREPLVHFLFLAGLLFAANHFWTGEKKETIVVEQQTADYLIQQREDLELRKLSSEEREQTIASYIEDEILYREAYNQGLDKGDSRMRRNLILKMRGLLISDLTEPTEEQLIQHFETNREKYTRPPTLTLNHVYYRDSTNDLNSVLQALNAGQDASRFGESFSVYGRKLPKYSARDLVGAFGPDIAMALLGLEDSEWQGPYESSRGFHFFRVVERHPAHQSTFEEVKPYLQSDWMMTQTRQMVESEVERLKQDYEIAVKYQPEVLR